MRLKQPAPALPSPTDLAAARRRFEEWRRTRTHRARIPDALWRAATELARAHGVTKIARALRLDYSALRRRLAPAPRASPPGSPAFVEWLPALAAPRYECVVELEHPRGARLRIQLTSPSLPDLAALSDSFWRGAP